MKKYIYKISLFLAALVFITGCQEEYPIMFDTSEILVGLNETSLSIRENQTGSFSIYLGGDAGIASTDVSIEISTDGISKPAIEDTDYTLSAKTVAVNVGMTAITITPIDNNIFEGNKQFKIQIASNSKSYPLSKQTALTVTIVDDEHPLKAWIGTYKVAAVSYWTPGEYDEVWNVTTSAHPTDVTKLIVRGIGTSSPSTTDWIGTVNTTDMTITFAPGQEIDEAYGYGPVLMFLGTPDITTVKESDIVGTIVNDGTILIDNLAIELTGANEGYVWDVFNTTWTKQ